MISCEQNLFTVKISGGKHESTGTAVPGGGPGSGSNGAPLRCGCRISGGQTVWYACKAVSFQDADLERAIRLIHEQGKKVYIACNALLREKELELVPDYFSFLQELGADALILADLGLFGWQSVMHRNAQGMSVRSLEC